MIEPLWFLGVAGITAWICYTDLRYYWIPDGAIVVLVLLQLVAWYEHLAVYTPITVLFISVFFGMVYYAYPQGLGTGDIKLVIVLSLGCSFWEGFVMVWVAFFLALLVSVWLWWRQGVRMIPFAPFLWSGWWIAKCLGNTIGGWIGIG